MKRRSNLIASSTTRHRCKPAKEKVGRCFADLPSSITTYILLQLPIKVVSICKCVCRTWNALISDPYFATLYFERASLCFMIRNGNFGVMSNTFHLFEYQPEYLLNVVCFNFDPKFKLPLRNSTTTCHLLSYDRDDKFAVVNSCNGLLCLSEPYSLYSPELTSVNHLVVCNPITGEFITLPETAPTRKTTCVGFGFQPKTNEYKVIRMWKTCDRWRCKSDVMAVEVHTLGTTTWRDVEVDPKFSSLWLERPASVNGALHWINFDSKIRSILCFNLESERFQSFPSPPSPPSPLSSSCITMVELKGFLYISESTFESCVVWLMKKYGISESWTKIFYADNFEGFPWNFGVCRPIKHFENGGGALMLQDSYYRDSFIYFEPGKHRSTTFCFEGAESLFFESIPHIPSLVSLKDIVKGNNIEVQNVNS